MSRTEEGGLEARAAGPPPPQHKRLKRALRSRPQAPEQVFPGIAVSAGIAIGPIFDTAEPAAEITRHTIDPGEIAAEEARLSEAVQRSRKQVGKLRSRLGILPEDTQAEIAPLLDAYAQMLGPSRLLRGASRRIAETTPIRPRAP